MPAIPSAFKGRRAIDTPVLRSHPLILAAFAGLALACGTSSPTTPPADGGPNAEASIDGGTPDGGGCVGSATGTHVYTCSGLAVTITAPSTCPAAGCGLILDVHGFLMDADVEDAMTHLRAIGTAAGYVIVQPTAPSGRVAQGPAWLDSDDGAVMDAVAATRSAFAIDAKRIHVTGLSQGGFMTFRLVCAHADLFASAAPALAGTASCPSGTLNGSCAFSGSDKPSRALPLLYMVGTKDALVPASCTDPQRDAIIAGWSLGAKQPVKTGTGWRRDRYAGPNGASLDLVSHDGTATAALVANAGHCVPGGGPTAPSFWGGLRCDGTTGLDWGAEVVAFFNANPKP